MQFDLNAFDSASWAALKVTAHKIPGFGKIIVKEVGMVTLTKVSATPKPTRHASSYSGEGEVSGTSPGTSIVVVTTIIAATIATSCE